MIDYSVFETAKKKVLLPSVKTDYSLFFMDAITTKTIVEKTVDGEFPYHSFPELLDEFDKHFYVQMEPGWLVNKNQIYCGMSSRRGEMRKDTVMQASSSRPEETDETWFFGEFCTTHLISEESAGAMRIVVSHLLHSLLHRQTMIIETNGHRTVLQKSKGKPRYRTIYLSDVAKRYVHKNDSSGADGYGGWKMPEHEVRGHLRTLPSGRVVKVRGHRRGDPAIERKTLPVQVKL